MRFLSPETRLAAAVFIAFGALVATTTAFGAGMLEARDHNYPHLTARECPRADAIAVLSGDGPPRLRQMYSQEKPNRSEEGLKLWLDGKAPNLVFTDGGPEGDRSREIAILCGVPAERVTVVRPARNTEDEARLIADLAGRRGWTRLILVTSGYHMARAKLFVEHAARERRAPLMVYPFAADSGKFFIRHKGIVDYLPGRGAEQFARTVREAFGEWACEAGVC